MGKRSKRTPRGPSTPRAPRTVPPEVHPFYESEFRPIELSADLRALPPVKGMLSMVEEGTLSDFKLGRKGTHISSYFSVCGTVDYLTSPLPDDDDYESLTRAHITRAFEVIRETMGPELWKRVTGRD